MNIIIFDENPWQSALWLDDVRKSKFILEAAQMLSTAIRFNDPFGTLPVYKAAYVFHPCTKWVRSSRENFGWCLAWMKALGEQKGGCLGKIKDRPCSVDHRSNTHRSLGLVDSFETYYHQGRFKQDKRTPFANCARNLERGVDFSHVSDVPSAYRLYMVERWKEKTVPLTWRWGEQPAWRNQA